MTQPHINPEEHALGDEVRPRRRANAAKRVIRANRRMEAFALRKQGESYEAIGQHLGVAPNTVSVWVREAIAQIPLDAAEDLRNLELARLDSILVPQMRLAQAGDGYAVDRTLRIMERRARYLNLDAATVAGVKEVGTLLDRLVFGGSQEEAS